MDEHPASMNQAVTFALDRAKERSAQQLSLAQIVGACTSLLKVSSAHQRLLAANSGKVGRPEVVQALLAMADRDRYAGGRRALKAARAAVAVAEALPASAATLEVRADFSAEAWACVANAQRIHGDLRAAESSWRAVDLYLVKGSGDTLLAAKLALRRSSLLDQQGDTGAATTLLEGAARTFVRLSEWREAGRCLMALANLRYSAGQLSEASFYALEAGRFIDSLADPAVSFGLVKNLVVYLHEGGKSLDAETLLPTVRELAKLLGEPLELLRLRWLESKIHHSAGRTVRARAELDAVRREFVRQGMAYDASLAALELALYYAEDGWHGEVEKLATEMYPVFLSRDLPHHATAALKLFVDAVERRAASPAHVRALITNFSARKL